LGRRSQDSTQDKGGRGEDAARWWLGTALGRAVPSGTRRIVDSPMDIVFIE